MRIIHTADWHLGRSLEGRSRLAEQIEFIDELAELVETSTADMVIVAGDVFDSSNPPAAAEQLFYQALDRLADGGRRAVVVIAGNHDHPERLAAAADLARRYGIVLAGLPGCAAQVTGFSAKRANIVKSGPGWLEISTPNSAHNAVIAVLPYPSESRLQEVLAATLDEEIMQKAYAERVRAILAEAGAHFRDDTVNLVISHLYVAGGATTESERDISLGGALAVGSDAFPARADYVALGHLHRCQQIKGEGPLVCYAGSPMAYSFAEAGQAKSVSLIIAEPGQSAQRQELFLTRGRPLVHWSAAGGLEEVRAWCEEGRDANAWVDLEVMVSAPLSIQETSELRSMHKGFVNIKATLPGTDPSVVVAENSKLSPEDLFNNYYYARQGAWPEPETVALFLELLSEINEPPPEGVSV